MYIQVSQNSLSSTVLRSHKISGKNVQKNLGTFFFVENMDLFVTLNVTTCKNIPFIPIICQYFFFFSIHENKKQQSRQCCHMLFEVEPT
jgi:hypothetical protein